jgi:superfamily II DNA or RNA helicase
MSVEDWQVQLRRQYGRDQDFVLEKLGREPLFTEYAVRNPLSDGRYHIRIGGLAPGQNVCSCPDFSTNDLGTCKHIEFALGKLERQRGAKSAFKRGFHPPHSELYLDYAGARRVRFRAGAACSAALGELALSLFDADGAHGLAPERYAMLPEFLAAAQAAGDDVRCRDDALGFIAEWRDAQERARLLDLHYPVGTASAALDGLLKIALYPYQARGALFAARAGRCLIGDEMGLGKTVQAIAAAELMIRHFGAQRVLVICPTSLKHQWQREITRFAGRDAQSIQGLRGARELQFAQDGVCKITNYELLARDLDLINAWAPDLVIVDEAQRIKNWNTIAARALKRIACPYAIVLTGTPLENRLEELLSIVQFVDRHRLGPTWRLLHQHQSRDDSGRVVGYRDLNHIGATLAPIMLRRHKADVLDQLPARVDKTLFVAMTPEQQAQHDDQGAIVKRIVHRWRKSGFLSDADQRRLTCSLQTMRMACNSTYLVDHETDHGVKVDELVNLLDDLLEDPAAKVVVFSQWLRTHELIERRLAVKGWDHVLFHGGVASAQRGALVDRFNGDPDCRVFLSTDAGGVGLNLQYAAAAIVNMDMPWNPAVLEQRIGRVHRIGQTRGVQVTNFVSRGSIEEGMLSVLAFKKSLFAGVLDGGDSEIFMHGTRLSQFMDSVDAVTQSMGQGEAPAEAPAPTHADGNADPVPDAARPAAPGAPALDPWAPLLDAGMQLVAALAQATDADSAKRPAWIETDSVTGASFIKLPLPDPQTVQRLAGAIGELMMRLRR